MKKVMFISSAGGHLTELMQLRSLFNHYDYNLVTEKVKSTLYLKERYQDKVYYLLYGTKDHILVYPFKLLFNTIKSLIIYLKLRPNFIVTTGAHTAGPMCCIGKLFGAKIIFIETFANITKPTITGKYIYKFADLFIIQWEELKKFYPKATYGRWIF